jgi:UDP-N-acetylmuramoyl-L-alanyl-D-glutamate--2,6-diaminopimelate ligase
MKLVQLLTALPHYQLLTASTSALEQVEISNFTADSRQVKPGTFFVAYQGVASDGHRFIPEAIAKGAAAIIGESEKSLLAAGGEAQAPPLLLVSNGREALAYLAAAWYNFPSRRLTMVGITGTDGKTTTTNFLYHLLKAAGRKVGMISTVNAVIGETVLETGLHTTTPDAPDIQRYLAEMVKAGTEICLLETTSHGLAQRRVAACNFDIAIVTNITHEHLDIHGSLEAYWAAKASLFESLAGALAKGLPKTAILNCDDGSFEYLKKKLAVTNTAWIGYSIANHPEATVTANDIVYGADRTRFTLKSFPSLGEDVSPSTGGGLRPPQSLLKQNREELSFPVETSLIGDYNVSNCLAATTTALHLLGVSPEAARQGIAALPGVPGRMERVDEGQNFTAIVDFAHTPNALRRSLTTARLLTHGRVIAVFGCAGLRDVKKRVLMGQIAAELADITLITAEDPRTENLTAIIAETAQAMLAQGAVEGDGFERVLDRGRAIYRAVQLARPGDVVITLGKGHEQSMCFGQTEYAWDDRQAMRVALTGQPLLTLPTAQDS